jgi:hypothetical protein
MSTSKILRSAALLGALVVLGVAALSAGGVDAAKGGDHGGGQTSGGATCSTTPASPIAFGSAYTLDGSGVPADAYLNVLVQSSAGLWSSNPPNVSGTWTLNLWADPAGSYVVTIQEVSGSKFSVLGTCSYSVSP